MSVDKHEYHYIPKFNRVKYYHPSQTMSVDKHEHHYIPKFNIAKYYHPSQTMSTLMV
jgi:CO dehydrogenase/acetyl-CoA synthase epsilon subunit